MYALAKFQPDMLMTFRVMALQSSNSKMVDAVYMCFWDMYELPKKFDRICKNPKQSHIFQIPV